MRAAAITDLPLDLLLKVEAFLGVRDSMRMACAARLLRAAARAKTELEEELARVLALGATGGALETLPSGRVTGGTWIVHGNSERRIVLADLGGAMTVRGIVAGVGGRLVRAAGVLGLGPPHVVWRENGPTMFPGFAPMAPLDDAGTADAAGQAVRYLCYRAKAGATDAAAVPFYY